jgi:hypothetical protein
MTALPLYDLLARRDRPGTTGDLAQFAGRLVQSALADLQLLGEYERHYASTDVEPEFERQLIESIYEQYAQWAQDAQQILARVADLPAGTPVPGGDQLADAHGKVRARLCVTPRQMAEADRQVREANTVPASELRNELRSRLRA